MTIVGVAGVAHAPPATRIDAAGADGAYIRTKDIWPFMALVPFVTIASCRLLKEGT